jgi:hypothetical protein
MEPEDWACIRLVRKRQARDIAFLFKKKKKDLFIGSFDDTEDGVSFSEWALVT